MRRGGSGPASVPGCSDLRREAPPARSPRYFGASLLTGDLYVQGMDPRKGWDPSRLVYLNGDDVDLVLRPRLGDRKIDTAADLEAALAAARESPTVLAKVWIREGLETEARRHWEASHLRRRRQAA